MENPDIKAYLEKLIAEKNEKLRFIRNIGISLHEKNKYGPDRIESAAAISAYRIMAEKMLLLELYHTFFETLRTKAEKKHLKSKLQGVEKGLIDALSV